ncbi:MAG: hypothetical protein HY398_02655 [Candidatus Doudnabacteria bacterium]|nr:hypothetical protein [Candidatus Doudnabacteria bacterium]
MNFSRLRWYALGSLAALCFGVLAAAAGLAFGYWPGLAERATGEPEYEFYFVQQLMTEWHRATGMPVVLRYEPELSEGEFERETGATFPPADPGWEEKNHQALRGALTNDPRFTRARLDSTIAEFILVDDSRLLLFAVYGGSSTVMQNGVPPPVVVFRAGDYTRVLGRLPAGPQIMKFPLYARLTRSEFVDFHWQAMSEPPQRNFYEQFDEIVGLWQTRLPPYSDFVEAVRLATGERLFSFRRIVRWWFTPAAFLFCFFTLAGLYGVYGSFLEQKLAEEYQRIPLPVRREVRLPQFLEFIRTADLAGLEVRYRTTFRAIRQEVLERARMLEMQRRAEMRAAAWAVAPLPVADMESHLKRRLEGLIALYTRKLNRVQTARDEIQNRYREAMEEQTTAERIAKLQAVIRLENEKIRSEHSNRALENAQNDRPILPVRHLRKGRLLFQQLSILDQFFGSEIDADMAKTILVVLWGQSQSGVRAHHRRRQTLGAKVWRFYTKELERSFHAENFRRTRDSLLRHGVIMSFDEFVKEGNYTIVAADSRQDRTPSGTQIARLLLQVAQSFKEVAV